jgi:hypothetical protein
MKQALTIGCGSKNGSAIIDALLEKGYNVTNMGNSNHPGATNITISWNDLQITNLHKLLKIEGTVDFVFFNQNASSLDSDAFDLANSDTLDTWKLIKDWQHSYWISCQMPFLIVNHLRQHLTNQSKIGWMLSSTMFWDRQKVEKYPDYSSQKYFNYLAKGNRGKPHDIFGYNGGLFAPDATLDNLVIQLGIKSLG